VTVTSNRPLLLATAALVVGLVGCGDDPTRPDELFEFAEAEVVVRSAAALPSLGDLALGTSTRDQSQRATLALAHQLWAAGSATDDLRGSAQRQAAATYATPVLAELVAEEEWHALRRRAESWMGTADRMLVHLALPEVELRLASARRHLDRSETATTRDARVYHLLMAFSDLVETTPRYVARGLVARAEEVVAGADADLAGPGSSASLDRARRLADWSARALEEGDDIRAIQRAYYAIQLVGRE
jgi:hypothetical protein